MTSPDGAVHVALATDAAYLPWCATAVLSCLHATAGPVVVHLLHAEDVPATALDRLRAMVEEAGGLLAPLPVADLDLGPLPSAVAAHGGAVSCARLLLPEALPHLDRVLYLDADTLVRRPLDGLWTADLGGHPVGAVRNVLAPDARDRLARLGLADTRRYLNSGVLVMDLARMRTAGTARALLACVRAHGDALLWVDQDALNLVLADDWQELHPRWNAQNSFWDWPSAAEEVLGAERVAEARADPAVLHFEGPWLCKPWHHLSHHVHVAAYRDVLAQTPWAGTPLVDRTLATRLIAQLPVERQVGAYLRLVRWRARTARLRVRSAARSA